MRLATHGANIRDPDIDQAAATSRPTKESVRQSMGGSTIGCGVLPAHSAPKTGATPRSIHWRTVTPRARVLLGYREIIKSVGTRTCPRRGHARQETHRVRMLMRVVGVMAHVAHPYHSTQTNSVLV